MKVENLYLHVDYENLSVVIKTISEVVEVSCSTKIIVLWNKLGGDFCIYFNKEIEVNMLVKIVEELREQGFVMEKFDNEIDILTTIENNGVAHVKFSLRG